NPQWKCLVIDNHSIFGGEAKRNEFRVGGKTLIGHQGSAVFFPPRGGDEIDGFYKDIQLDWRQFQYQDSAEPVGNNPYLEGGKTTGIYFGEKFGAKRGLIVSDPWTKKLAGAPLTATQKSELLKLQGEAAF